MAMLDESEHRTPGRRSGMIGAFCHVRPGELADPSLFDFAGLAIGAASTHTTPETP
jgi:tRNA 2-thiocytidine biosynthesis protein TtcA